jgi:arabinogalactan endo-1,4-beta-galactosidase
MRRVEVDARRGSRGYLLLWLGLSAGCALGCGAQAGGERSAQVTLVNYSNLPAEVTIGSDVLTVGAESTSSQTVKWNDAESTTVPIRATAVGRTGLTSTWSITVKAGEAARTFVEFDSATQDRVGAVPCDYLARRVWDTFWSSTDPIRVLRAKGFGWVRVGVTTVSSSDLRNAEPSRWGSLPWKNEYWSSLEYAGQILSEAAAAGMRLQVFLFLSHTAAHAGVQDAPPEWRELGVSETAQALESYTYATVKALSDRGLHVEAYELGNEIEAGILNFRPGDRIPRPSNVDVTKDMSYMRTHVWTVEAELLRAAIRGVRRGNPAATIVLHADSVGFNNDNTRTRTFFETMVEYGVEFDVVGLSYPYSMYAFSDATPKPYFATPHFAQLLEASAALGKRVQISEYSYPNDSSGTSGQADSGYPFSPEGQASWVDAFLSSCLSRSEISRVFYFYPEYFRGMHHREVPEIESSGLFRSDREVQPALRVFFK